MKYILLNQAIFIIVVVFIPLPTIQHFKWPVPQCLMADICNHTFIPDCGKDNLSEEIKLFLDTCDMNEFNCDHRREFMPVAYKDCFKRHTGCPKCPSCPNNLRMGAYTTVRPVSIRKSWVQGIRRYKRIPRTRKPPPPPPPILKTGKPPKKKTFQLKTLPTTKSLKTKTEFQLKTLSATKSFKTKTEILKKETVWRNGRLYHKVVKAIHQELDESDWLA